MDRSWLPRDFRHPLRAPWIDRPSTRLHAPFNYVRGV